MIPFLFFAFQCFKIGKYFMVNLKNIKKRERLLFHVNLSLLKVFKILIF